MASVAPYTPAVPDSSARPILLNRITLVLGFVGLFISGYLSYVKASGLMPLCGASGGCMAVTSHPAAYWFGIPVAYFGLAGYLALTGLATIRELAGRELSRVLVGLGLIISTFGLFASGYLMFVATTQIGETCKWCIGSATTMLLTFIAHSFLYGQAADAEKPVYRPRLSALPFVISGLLVTGTAIALVPKSDERITEVKVAPGLQLVPANANTLGEASAPLTIVEFADFCCPACRATAMSTRKLVQTYPGKVRLVFRQFPLLGVEGHEMSYPLAIASEYAAKQGKFWAFHEAVMTSPQVPKSLDEVITIGRNIGLSQDDLAKIVDGKAQSDSFDKVYADQEEGAKLGVSGTPTFFVQVNGGPTKKVAFNSLEKSLSDGEFSRYVK
ncbi:hypothetical protein EON77_01610 [bacterium]|nr:MAG: hypothetical protein EON77_01610 [bacterium]